MNDKTAAKYRVLLRSWCASVHTAQLEEGMQMAFSALIRDTVIELQMH